MDNLELYEKVRQVPERAQKKIEAGRLKGMTDINPMWRIKVLTEQFGVCGVGWKPQIVRTWIDNGANGEAITNVEILLFVKIEGQWSEGIPGIGGSRLVSKENSGLYTDDECYKKAYTDAISVACKLLGIGADVYWEKDSTKYSPVGKDSDKKTDPPKKTTTTIGKGKSKWAQVNELIKDSEITLDSVTEWLVKKKYPSKINSLTDGQFTELMTALKNKIGGKDNE